MVIEWNGRFIFPGGRSFEPHTLSNAYQEHVLSDPITAFLEKYARQYVRRDFPLAETKGFVSAVCRWGGNSRAITARVLRMNDVQTIRDSLFHAYQDLVEHNYASAVTYAADLREIGMSYWTKHLRFLYPTRAVILDRVIRTKLDYQENSAGFVKFLSDCLSVRNRLNDSGVPCGDSSKPWRVCDVEAAVYLALQGI